MSEPTKIDIPTRDGVAPASIHRPSAKGDHPGVILFPDAGGPRELVHEMADRLAARGYVVMVPSIFYRAGEVAPFDFKTVWGDATERERLMILVRSLDYEKSTSDAGHFIRALHEQAGVKKGGVGCFGYCIGGKLAFSAACAHGAEVAAAASIHGGGIATDAPDSPHLRAGDVRARLYFGIADNDSSCSPEQQAMLVSTLAAAHVRFTIDHFSGAAHGFAMADFPVYQQTAADKHWQRLEELFGEALGHS